MLGFIAAFLPFVIQFALSLLKKAGVPVARDVSGASVPARQWVHDGVVELFTSLDSRFPWWLKPEEGLIEELLTTAVNKALDSAGL